MRRWCAVALWMGLIFALSSVPSLTIPGGPIVNLVLRKLAHFGEFAVLTGLLWWALRIHVPNPLQAGLLAVLTAVLFACSDEWHQTWIAGRYGTFRDVGIDTLGIVGSYALVQWGHVAMQQAHGARQCPRCQGERLNRSRRRGIMEWSLRAISLYPFRCDVCDYRFLRFTRHPRALHRVSGQS